MDNLRFHNLGKNFNNWKDERGIEHDTGELLEGAWMAVEERKVKEFERAYPGIREELDKLLSLLPDPNNPDKKEFPFAASVFRMTEEGKIEVLARTKNRVNKRVDSTQHAELAAIQDAQEKIGSKHLDSCILLSTAQPCEMCTGAIRNTNIGTVVYAVSQDDMKGTHVKFQEEYKPIRTTPDGFDSDELLCKSGVHVVAGYRRKDVLKKLERIHGSFSSYYRDPDA